MPLYEYQCVKCEKRTERIESVSGPHLKKCPHCGGKVERMLTAPAIQFKGTGWYVTDYAGKAAAKDAPAESGASDGKEPQAKEPAAKETSTSSRETKNSKEKKSAKKK